MYRQFVNLIMHDQRNPIYSMRRLGIIPHLFHESSAAPGRNNKSTTISSCNLLPRSEINFTVPPWAADATIMHFFTLLKGQGDGCVMFTAPYRDTTVYDVALQSIIAMPQPNFCKPSDSIALSTTHGHHHQLYVVGRAEGCGFLEVLNYCRAGDPTVRAAPCWYWDQLPTPPQQLSDLLPGGGGKTWAYPSAAALVDDTTICMSYADGGAYAYDTDKRQWRQAGGWALPFCGAAEYVPELGLWFGLEATGGNRNPRHRLCAFDLSSSSSSGPPVVQHAWDYLEPRLLPGDWLPGYRQLVNLGSGRFCIAASFGKPVNRTVLYGFSSDEGQEEIEYGEVTLLTGVHVVRCSTSGALEMIKHKSRLYDIQCISIHSVL